jgi:hypothetical protein
MRFAHFAGHSYRYCDRFGGVMRTAGGRGLALAWLGRQICFRFV